VRAVGICYSTKLIYTCYESAHEAEIDKGHEEGIRARSVVGEERSDSPGCSEYRDDEENENVVWCQGVVGSILMHEPCKHPKCRDQSDNLKEAPKGEHDSAQHDC